MKRRLIFCMLAGILFASCMDDPLESPPAVVDKPMSRFIVTNNESETNPDLISDWENQETITIMDTAKDKVIVDAPWVDQGASTSMPGEFRRNIKKKDGWIMLFHTFKLKTGTNSQNYMCFYNLFTGVIKVFFYCDQIPATGTHTIWKLYCEAKEGETIDNLKFFDSPNFFTLPDDEPTTGDNGLEFSNFTSGKLSSLFIGWHGFEYQVPRYSNDLVSADFNISQYNELITKYSFLGKTNSNITGLITSETKFNASTGKYDGIAKVAGDKAYSWLKDLNVKKDEEGNPTDKTFINPSLIELAKGVITGSVSSILKSGLSLIFGRSSVVKTATTESDVQLQNNGTIEFDGGSMSLTEPGIPKFSFDMHQILTKPVKYNPNPGFPVYPGLVPMSDISVIAKETMHLGVWTVKSAPKVYWNRIVELKNWKIIGPYQESDFDMEGDIEPPTVDNIELEVEINPDIKKYIKSYDISTDVVFLGLPKLEQASLSTIPFGDYIYCDTTMTLAWQYHRPRHVSMVTGCQRDWFKEDITNCYFEWQLPALYHSVVFVTLTMNIEYEGNSFTVQETRAYKAKDLTSTKPRQQASNVHKPPLDVLVNNNGRAWVYVYDEIKTKTAGIINTERATLALER